MLKAQALIGQNRRYFAAIFLFFGAGIFYLLWNSKAAGFLHLAPYHNHFLDTFFIIYTNVGDGLFSIAVGCLLLIFRRFYLGWPVLTAYAISGLLSQLLKQLVYSPRPREYFKWREHIHLIDGVTLTGNSSFPSGHSTSAFALASILALYAKNKNWAFLFLIPAILVGYSRIYLSQHFPIDVLSGALLGFLSALFVYYLFQNKIKQYP